LTKNGGAARFVGGAVRNALSAKTVGDIDIATPLCRRGDAALAGGASGAVPTGIEHGTLRRCLAASRSRSHAEARCGNLRPARGRGVHDDWAEDARGATSPSTRFMPAMTAPSSTISTALRFGGATRALVGDATTAHPRD
jgi:hypothetical protein